MIRIADPASFVTWLFILPAGTPERGFYQTTAFRDSPVKEESLIAHLYSRPQRAIVGGTEVHREGSSRTQREHRVSG